MSRRESAAAAVCECRSQRCGQHRAGVPCPQRPALRPHDDKPFPFCHGCWRQSGGRPAPKVEKTTTFKLKDGKYCELTPQQISGCTELEAVRRRDPDRLADCLKHDERVSRDSLRRLQPYLGSDTTPAPKYEVDNFIRDCGQGFQRKPVEQAIEALGARRPRALLRAAQERERGTSLEILAISMTPLPSSSAPSRRESSR